VGYPLDPGVDLTACLRDTLHRFIDPASQFNPLKPGAGPFSNPTVTLTATPLQLEPTWTASPTLALTPSDTPRPTFTPIFTDTPFSLVPPTKTPKPTNTPKITFAFSVTVKAIASTISSGESLFVFGWQEAVDNKNAPYKFELSNGGTLGKTIDPCTTVTWRPVWLGDSK
jgi:hypothetical protein